MISPFQKGISIYGSESQDEYRVTTVSQVHEWAATVPQRVQMGSHEYFNFTATPGPESTILVNVSFKWMGISTQGAKLMGAESNHNWVLENDPDQAFPKMKDMGVTFTVPFHIVS